MEFGAFGLYVQILGVHSHLSLFNLCKTVRPSQQQLSSCCILLYAIFIHMYILTGLVALTYEQINKWIKMMLNKFNKSMHTCRDCRDLMVAVNSDVRSLQVMDYCVWMQLFKSVSHYPQSKKIQLWTLTVTSNLFPRVTMSCDTTSAEYFTQQKH